MVGKCGYQDGTLYRVQICVLGRMETKYVVIARLENKNTPYQLVSLKLLGFSQNMEFLYLQTQY